MKKPNDERNSSNQKLTVSESVFEGFLDGHKLCFERIPTAESEARPDYIVIVNDKKLIFEVKEIASDENFREGSSSREVGDHIRDKIAKARTQIGFGSDQGIPSILLIYNNLDPMQMFGTEDHDFVHAMYGEHTISIEKSSGKIIDSFWGRNESFTSGKKTYFSALARLKVFKTHSEVTLFENIYASVPVDFGSLPSCFQVKRFEI